MHYFLQVRPEDNNRIAKILRQHAPEYVEKFNIELEEQNRLYKRLDILVSFHLNFDIDEKRANWLILCGLNLRHNYLLDDKIGSKK